MKANLLFGLLSLVLSHDVLRDAEVVDHLRYAEEGRDDDHAAEGPLEEGGRALVGQDLAEGVAHPGVGLLGGTLVQGLRENDVLIDRGLNQKLAYAVRRGYIA